MMVNGKIPELKKIAQEHDIKIGTIEDLIKYRTKHEKTVIKKNESSIKYRVWRI